MIWVRWAIPDISSDLRDKIRREAYITNEIIIKQEAERARKQTNGEKKIIKNSTHFPLFDCYSFRYYVTDRIGDASIEPDIDMKRMEQLMTNNLSGSQLDLVIHGDGDPFLPGHVKPNQYENDQNETHRNDNELNQMFLESEKLRNPNKHVSNTIANSFELKEHDEPLTESSTL